MITVKIAETIVEKYQVRKTRRQKTEFIDFMQQSFPGIRVEKSGLFGSRNLIYGDIEKADVIFTAHYDTVVENMLPNLIMPYAAWLKVPYMLLVIAPMVIVMLAVKFGMLALGASDDVSSICMLTVYALMFAYMFFFGVPNKHTANDNTSGVLALINIMQRLSLSPALPDKAAFVFFDNEEYGCVGSGAFYKAHKELMQDKLIFNMDCVGEGDNFLFITSQKANERFGEKLRSAFTSDDKYSVRFDDAKKIKFPSDQKHFPVSVALAALHSHKVLGLWVGRIHTRRDTVCDVQNIEYIARHAMQFIENE